jgi:3-oxoacyl-[acyl-carrier-protein] synthase-3
VDTNQIRYQERRWVKPGVANSDLALPACQEAIQNAGISPDDIDAIVVGTVTSDFNFPGMAPIIQQKLGISAHVLLMI